MIILTISLIKKEKNATPTKQNKVRSTQNMLLYMVLHMKFEWQAL